MVIIVVVIVIIILKRKNDDEEQTNTESFTNDNEIISLPTFNLVTQVNNNIIMSGIKNRNKLIKIYERAILKKQTEIDLAMSQFKTNLKARKIKLVDNPNSNMTALYNMFSKNVRTKFQELLEILTSYAAVLSKCENGAKVRFVVDVKPICHSNVTAVLNRSQPYTIPTNVLNYLRTNRNYIANPKIMYSTIERSTAKVASSNTGRLIVQPATVAKPFVSSLCTTDRTEIDMILQHRNQK